MQRNLVVERGNKQCAIRVQQKFAARDAQGGASSRIALGFIRQVHRNLAQFYDLYEFFVVRGKKRVESMPAPAAVLPLGAHKLVGGEQFVVFYPLSPALSVDRFEDLSPRQLQALDSEMQLGHTPTRQDYRTYRPAAFNVLGCEDFSRLVSRLKRIHCHNVDGFFNTVCHLCEVVVTLENADEMIIDFMYPDVIELALENTSGCIFRSGDVDKEQTQAPRRKQARTEDLPGALALEDTQGVEAPPASGQDRGARALEMLQGDDVDEPLVVTLDDDDDDGDYELVVLPDEEAALPPEGDVAVLEAAPALAVQLDDEEDGFETVEMPEEDFEVVALPDEEDDAPQEALQPVVHIKLDGEVIASMPGAHMAVRGEAPDEKDPLAFLDEPVD
nr:hypothetical protein [Maliibacterium massiliense]